MKIDDLIHSLKELTINLKNPNVIQTLEKEQFDLIILLRAINIYLSNQTLITEELANRLAQKVIDLISYTNKNDFKIYYNNFLNPANFLIDYANELELSNGIKRTTNDSPHDNLNLIPSITEEEFSKRYFSLVDKLNIYPKESNLILETPSEKKPFKVFKNTAYTIVIRSGQEEKPMSLTKDALLDMAYRGKIHRLVYARVIINKIMDNSIFDFIIDTDLKEDLIETIKNKLLKQENEFLIFKEKFDDLQKNDAESQNTKEQFLQMLSQAKNAEQEYLSAKEAAVNDTKLKASVNYWEEKQTKHQRQFKIYGAISIALIILLITILSIVISNHNSNSLIDNDNTIFIAKIVDKNITDTKNNISKAVTLKSNTQDNNQTSENLSQNPLAYIHFIGWYALLIFASSSALWIIRIVVKIGLSNLHLSEDAHERVVMIQTYLAFIKEGHGLEENDKQLILSSLFRPSNIGIIQDESSITVADIVSSLKAK